MTTLWYLVKRNWPRTSAAHPLFGGVGGDVWPLDGAIDAAGRAIHQEVMASRSLMEVGGSTELLCADLPLAEAYCDEANRHGDGAWLLELRSGHTTTEPVDGFDLGFPSGGGSLVESERITQGRPGPSLNKWALFDSKTDAMAYLAEREGFDDLEEAEDVELLAVRVLRHDQVQSEPSRRSSTPPGVLNVPPFTWGDAARIKQGARTEWRPGALVSIVGIRTVETEATAHEFGAPVGTTLFTVEFVDGSSTEIPEVWLEADSDS